MNNLKLGKFETAYGTWIEVIDIQHHRNGVGGAPFYAVIFKDLDTDAIMIGTVFEAQFHVSAYRIDLLAKNNINFGENSHRGDVYEPALREAIRATGGES